MVWDKTKDLSKDEMIIIMIETIELYWETFHRPLPAMIISQRHSKLLCRQRLTVMQVFRMPHIKERCHTFISQTGGMFSLPRHAWDAMDYEAREIMIAEADITNVRTGRPKISSIPNPAKVDAFHRGMAEHTTPLSSSIMNEMDTNPNLIVVKGFEGLKNG